MLNCDSSDEKVFLKGVEIETMGKRKTKKTYRCITCGEKISEEEYEANGGQCDNCVIEDTVYASEEFYE